MGGGKVEDGEDIEELGEKGEDGVGRFSLGGAKDLRRAALPALGGEGGPSIVLAGV